MQKIKIFLLILVSCTTFLFFRSDTSDAFSLFKKSDSDLKNLPLLKYVIELVEKNYVEPNRIKASDMFVSALKRLQAEIPEVRVVEPDQDHVVLIVNDKNRLPLPNQMINTYSLSPAISKALLFIKENLISDVKDEDFQQMAIQGILETLDPHSIFLNKEQWEEQQIGTKGSFGGIGVVIGIRDGKLTVIAPLEGTPAAKAGLKAKDVITKIEDESTINMTLPEAVNLMRGPRGEAVTISVKREGLVADKSFKIVRDIIKTKSTEVDRLDNGILYLQVKSFQSQTSNEVERILADAKVDGHLKGLILDLRNNPGGLLSQAIKLSDLFVSKGPIVSTVNRANKQGRREQASERGTYDDFPMVVLVNGGSASASEIVAGAIKYLNRGAILGQRTFGKGSVQMLFTLPEETALKLTVEKYLTANDTSIQNVGIYPDIRLEPVFVSDETVNMFSGSFLQSEADFEGRVNTKGLKQIEEHELFLVRYLESRNEEDTEINYGKQDPMKDFEVVFAWNMLKESRYLTRDKSLKDIRLFVEDQAKKQRVEISTALQAKKIKWDSKPNLAQKKRNKCANPVASTNVKGVTSKAVSSGDEAIIDVTIENKGSCALYNFWAMSQSEDYFLDRKEFIFGTIQPKEKREFSVKVAIPHYAPTRLAGFNLNFFEDEEDHPLVSRSKFVIRDKGHPSFAFNYRMEDRRGQASEKSKIDGLAQPGENIRFHIAVKNIGDAASEENIVTLKNLSGAGIFLKKGREKLGKLIPGQTLEVHFDFDIRPYFEKENFELELTVQDSQHLRFLKQKLTVPVTKTGPEGTPQKLAKAFQATQEVAVLSGANKDARSIGELAPGAKFKVTEKWGDFYKIQIPGEEHDACNEGWISNEGLSPLASAGNAKTINFQCDFERAPKVVLAKGLHLTQEAESNFVRVKGTIIDDQSIKDMYIVVNKEKVYYRSFIAAPDEVAKDEKKQAQASKAKESEQNAHSREATAKFEAIIPLEKGVNNVFLIARDNQDFIAQERAVLLYKPEEAHQERLTLK